MILDVGQTVPKFTLPATYDSTLSVPSGSPLVLYFYPKDDTPGCTLEAVEFTQAKTNFHSLGIAIAGISPDPVTKHEKFCKKHNLEIMLAADEDQSVMKTFGVWVEKKMYGRTFMGVERSTFLIDSDGKILEAWRKVRAKGHVDAVLAVAKQHYS